MEKKSRSPSKMQQMRGMMILGAVALLLLQDIVEADPHRVRERIEEPMARIVGGIQAKRSYPYTVALYGPIPEYGTICGGTLILPDVVLTAAHCFNYIDIARTDLINKFDKTAEQFDIVKEEGRRHPLYGLVSGNNNDVALLKLSGNSSARTVVLNGKSGIPVVGSTVRVLGWGRLSEGGSSPDNLREVDVNAISNQQCSNLYLGSTISDDMLCAYVPGGGKDACQGDSGGPLIVANDANPFLDALIGVVSWGYGCAGPLAPGVYSRVEDQIEWITTNACEMSNVLDTNGNCPLKINTDPIPTPIVPATLKAPNPVNATAAYAAVATSAQLLPSKSPSNKPSLAPTNPLNSTTKFPSRSPSRTPSTSPSKSPAPSRSPSSEPTQAPTVSSAPTRDPSPAPSRTPSSEPTPIYPSSSPSESPTSAPTVSTEPSTSPSTTPSSSPTISSEPTATPSSKPSDPPTATPSSEPTHSAKPSMAPSHEPTFSPTTSMNPSFAPTTSPTETHAPTLELMRSMSEFERSCQDNPGTFPGRGNVMRTCAWVKQYRWYRCQYHCSDCPITCFRNIVNDCLTRETTCLEKYGTPN